MIPCGLPIDPQECLSLMLKMKLNKDTLTLEEVVMVLDRQLAKPHS